MSLKDNNIVYFQFQSLDYILKKNSLWTDFLSALKGKKDGVSRRTDFFFCPAEPVSDTHAHWPHPGSQGERVQAEDLPPRRGQPGTVCFLFFSNHLQTTFVIMNNSKFVFILFQSPLAVTLPSPEPLTAAMFLFLLNMKEPGKGPVNPKLLFNQLCQKYAFLHSGLYKIVRGFSLNGLSFPLACCATVVLVLHLSFTCFQSVFSVVTALTSQTQAASGPSWMKVQRTWNTANGNEPHLMAGFFFFLCCLLLLCHLCHIWSRSQLNKLNHCCVRFSVQMFGWLGSFRCSDAWVHHVRVSRGHLVRFSSAGGWPGRLLPDDWIGLWCGFDSYSGATLSSDRQMCVHVACHLTWYHLILQHTHSGSKCTHLDGHVYLIKYRKNPLYFTDMHLNRNYFQPHHPCGRPLPQVNIFESQCLNLHPDNIEKLQNQLKFWTYLKCTCLKVFNIAIE